MSQFGNQNLSAVAGVNVQAKHGRGSLQTLLTRASVSRPILVIKTTNGQTLLQAKDLAVRFCGACEKLLLQQAKPPLSLSRDRSR